MPSTGAVNCCKSSRRRRRRRASSKKAINAPKNRVAANTSTASRAGLGSTAFAGQRGAGQGAERAADGLLQHVDLLQLLGQVHPQPGQGALVQAVVGAALGEGVALQHQILPRPGNTLQRPLPVPVEHRRHEAVGRHLRQFRRRGAGADFVGPHEFLVDIGIQGDGAEIVVLQFAQQLTGQRLPRRGDFGAGLNQADGLVDDAGTADGPAHHGGRQNRCRDQGVVDHRVAAAPRQHRQAGGGLIHAGSGEGVKVSDNGQQRRQAQHRQGRAAKGSEQVV